MKEPVYGEVIGADFTERGDARIVIHVAVSQDERIGRRHVVILEATDYEALTT